MKILPSKGGLDFFDPKMALASAQGHWRGQKCLSPLWKAWFSLSTPSNGPRYGFSRLKIIISRNIYRIGTLIVIMYRRRILCTLYGAVDFLNVLKKGCWGGGGGLVVHNEIDYVPLGEGWEEVMVRNVLPTTPHTINTSPQDTQHSCKETPPLLHTTTHNNTTQQHSSK